MPLHPEASFLLVLAVALSLQARATKGEFQLSPEPQGTFVSGGTVALRILADTGAARQDAAGGHTLITTCRSFARPLNLAGLGLCVLAGSPRATLAQRRTTSLHGTIALGTGSMGFSGLVSGTVQRGHGALSLRTSGNLPSDPSPVASDLGLVVHYAARSRGTFLSIGAGLAAVFTGDSARIYTAPVNAHTTVGLPLEAQAFWRPISGLGLGAIAYGDLNPRRSFVGVLLGIQFGGFQR